MNPLVSIVIPTYNRAQLIKETLDSVMQQTYTNWECVIVDDGSDEPSITFIQDYIKKDESFSFFSRPAKHPKGPSSCRNYGVEKSTGDYLLFLDADDWLATDCLQNRVGFAKSNDEFDLFVFKTAMVYENQYCELLLRKGASAKQDYFELFKNGSSPFYVHSCLWKRATFNSLGGFDVQLKRLEDPDLHLRFFINNGKALSSMHSNADSYYRKQIIGTSISDSELIKHSYTYHQKHSNLLQPQILEFMRTKVLVSGSISYCLKYYRMLIGSKATRLKVWLFTPILIGYKFLNLDQIKGLGFYKLTQLTYKSE
jgi:glycosyltransferase involved in cell wall biosynthesis